MDDRLGEIFERQLRLQTESFGISPGHLVGPDRYTYLLNNFEAVADELAEMRAETAWKMWAKYPVETGSFLDRDAFVKEGVDLLHFLINLLLIAGCDAQEMYDRYMAKAQVNAERQANNYDGVSTKCPACGRGLDEPDLGDDHAQPAHHHH